jgi:hypothetical protein
MEERTNTKKGIKKKCHVTTSERLDANRNKGIWDMMVKTRMQ